MTAVPGSPPDNVNTTAISPTEIMVTWDIVPEIDQNGVITMYEVLYVPLETFGGAIGDNTTIVMTERMATLTDLQEYVNYTISVRAYTSVGAGPYSDGMIVRTQEDSESIASLAYNCYCFSSCPVPDSPPDNVNTTAISPTEIMVTWDIVPEIDQNGVITRYEVLYVPLETFDGAIGENTTNVTGRMATLTDLQEYVSYNISVQAYTSVGAGPYGDGVIEMTNEAGMW